MEDLFDTIAQGQENSNWNFQIKVIYTYRLINLVSKTKSKCVDFNHTYNVTVSTRTSTDEK